MAATAAAFLEVDRCGLFSLPLSLSPRSFLLPRRQLPGLRLFVPSRRFHPCRLSAALVPSSKAASKSDSHREDSLEGVEAVVLEPTGSQGRQLRKRVIFGLGIGLGAGGVVVAGGWVFTVALAAAVFAGAREYFELVRSRGIAAGMTPPPRYVSRVCSAICALMPILTQSYFQDEAQHERSQYQVAEWKETATTDTRASRPFLLQQSCRYDL